MFKVGIVGAGFIGRKRAENATAHLDTQVALVYDVQEEVAAEVAAENGGQVATSWQELVAADLDIVTVATTHDALAEISTADFLPANTYCAKSRWGVTRWRLGWPSRPRSKTGGC